MTSHLTKGERKKARSCSSGSPGLGLWVWGPLAGGSSQSALGTTPVRGEGSRLLRVRGWAGLQFQEKPWLTLWWLLSLMILQMHPGCPSPTSHWMELREGCKLRPVSVLCQAVLGEASAGPSASNTSSSWRSKCLCPQRESGWEATVPTPHGPWDFVWPDYVYRRCNLSYYHFLLCSPRCSHLVSVARGGVHEDRCWGCLCFSRECKLCVRVGTTQHCVFWLCILRCFESCSWRRYPTKLCFSLGKVNFQRFRSVHEI